jgi:hypothetical protein
VATAPVASNFDGCVHQCSSTQLIVGDDAPVVEKGQRRQRSAKKKTVDVNQRQDPDNASIPTSRQIDGLVTKRATEHSTPRPGVIAGRAGMVRDESIPFGGF